MFFDPGIIEAFRNLLPGLTQFFIVVTELGSDLFYIGLLLTGYWAFNKRESIIATYVLLISVLSNYWIKYIIAHDRPPVSYRVPGVETPNYSTPSGHSQNSATLFGWFSVRIKKWWMLTIGIVLTTLIGLSRVYLGVHYLEDVLLGWGIGILTVILLFYLERPVREYLSRFRSEYLLVVVFAIGLVLTVIAGMLPAPPDDNFGAIGGLMMGLAIGFMMEARFVDFTVEAPNGQRWRLVLRVVIGLVFVLGLMLGLESLLPTEEIFLRAIRYFLVTFTGIFIWPWIFKKANL
jgi:membrane-associated phospholipid phosphatase